MKLFFGGLPTEPDVKRLREKFGLPTNGSILKYDDITDTVGAKFRSGRWNSVVMAWRKELFRESNIVLIPERGVGLKAATNAERVHKSWGDLKSGTRKVRRASHLATVTAEDGLNDEEKVKRGHAIRVGTALQLAAATESRKISWTISPPKRAGETENNKHEQKNG